MVTHTDNSTRIDRAEHLSRLKRVLQWIAFAFTVAASSLLSFLPVYSGVTSDSNGTSTETSATLVQVNGPSVLIPLAVPIAISLVPLLARGRAWQTLSIVATVLLGVAVFLGILSIGVFFLPALIVEIIAACLPAQAASRKTSSTASLST